MPRTPSSSGTCAARPAARAAPGGDDPAWEGLAGDASVMFRTKRSIGSCLARAREPLQSDPGGSIVASMRTISTADLTQLDEYRWQIAREGAMRVPGVIFASRALLERMLSDRTFEQVKNAAELPGILEASIAM